MVSCRNDQMRMGPPIRHLTAMLKGLKARTRRLVTLSDGKPDDYDLEYCGDYGTEDARQAWFAARRDGIRRSSIIIDAWGREYCPRIKDAAHYVVDESFGKLPLKGSEIRRKSTG